MTKLFRSFLIMLVLVVLFVVLVIVLIFFLMFSVDDCVVAVSVVCVCQYGIIVVDVVSVEQLLVLLMLFFC